MGAPTKNQRTPDLTIERELAYPLEKVFKAWTDQNALRKWMGPGEVKSPDAEIDPRKGGRLIIPMVNPDGRIYTARGEIKELIPNQKLRFTWCWDQEDGSPGQVMEITLEFHSQGDGTRLVLHQTNFIDEEARDKHAFGWHGCFDNLATYLASDLD